MLGMIGWVPFVHFLVVEEAQEFVAAFSILVEVFG